MPQLGSNLQSSPGRHGQDLCHRLCTDVWGVAPQQSLKALPAILQYVFIPVFLHIALTHGIFPARSNVLSTASCKYTLTSHACMIARTHIPDGSRCFRCGHLKVTSLSHSWQCCTTCSVAAGCVVAMLLCVQTTGLYPSFDAWLLLNSMPKHVYTDHLLLLLLAVLYYFVK